MNDINCVTMTGRLTKDAEVKEVSNGWAIYKISLANGYSEKDKEGKWVDKVNFLNCKMFRKGVEFSQYLKKGQQIAISGCNRQESWEKDGQKRSAIVVMIDSLILCGKGNEKPSGNRLPVNENMEPQPDEGIPF